MYNEIIMNVQINKFWKKELSGELEKDYFKNLTKFIGREYSSKKVYPRLENIFRAFDLCSFDDTKVVILGQDPYHGQGQAHGLCFSVRVGVQNPPSLKNIFKEIVSDTGEQMSGSGELSEWARQGVLLLNATLTVLAGSAASHQRKGWEEFTDAVIEIISDKKESVVFLLWGAYAQSKGELIDSQKHLILKAPHPSPLSAYRGFFGCKHFSQANKYLKNTNQGRIDWTV